MEDLKYVVFRLGDQKYGMSLQHINGIEQGYQIIPVPNAPAGIKGIINLRGVVIPVYSLREQFGMDSRIDGNGKSLLVTACGTTFLAYEVDEVLMIEEVSKEKLNKMPDIVSNDENAYLDKVLHIGKDIVMIINAEMVLSEEMREKVLNLSEENNTTNNDSQNE